MDIVPDEEAEERELEVKLAKDKADTVMVIMS